MATAGTVTIRLDADSARLVRELDKANKKTKGFARKLRKDITAAAKSFALIGASAAAALAVIVKSSADAIDALAKTADKLGATTEALAGLQLAGEITGIQNKAFALGIQRMTRRIAEAGIGLGEARGALEELGLSAVTLSQLTIDEQFFAIADAMGKVTSQSDKIRLGFKLFDSEGVDLIRTLALGSDQLRAFREEAEQLGIAISRVDAKQIENAKDAATRAAAATKGIANNLTIIVSPLLEQISEGFTESALKAQGFKEEIDGTITPLAVIVAGAKNISAGINLASLGVLALGAQLVVAATAVTEFFQNIRDGVQSAAGVFGGPEDNLFAAVFGGKKERAEIQSDLDEAQGTLDEIVKAIAEIKFVGGEEIEQELRGVIRRAQERAAAEIAARDTGTVVDAILPTAAQIEERLRLVAEKQLGFLLLAAERRTAVEEAVRAAIIAGEELTGQRITELAVAEATARVAAVIEAEKAAKAAAGEVFELDPVAREEKIQAEVLKVVIRFAKLKGKVTAEEAKKELKQAALVAKLKQDLAFSVANTAIGLLRQLGGKSKAAAIAAIALEKGVAIARVIINTEAAKALAFAQLGIYAAPFVAFLEAARAVSIGLIVASGIAQASAVGGGGAAPGSPGGPPIITDPIGTADDGTLAPGFTGQTIVQVTIQGDVVGSDESIQRLADALRQAIDDRDVVIISSDSRQASEITGG